ncbi:MAG: hypothetical protein GY798_23655 [Hyphomicrobiales bacterium]|nr:hypothetical protein [Hyphomicrobiales bacterium]
MIYHVQATAREANAKELLEKLTDGTLARQRPDGPEPVASMKRAVINPEGRAEWSEMCFTPARCSTRGRPFSTSILTISPPNLSRPTQTMPDSRLWSTSGLIMELSKMKVCPEFSRMP